MTKKQKDLFGNTISAGKMREVEKGISNKITGRFNEVLATLKADMFFYDFLNSKAYSQIQVHTQLLNDQNLRDIALLLKKMHDVEKTKNYEFIENIAKDKGKLILLDIVSGISFLYRKIKAQTIDLEIYRAYFEMLVFFTEEVFERIKILLEEATLRLGVTKFRVRQLDRIIANYLKSVVIVFDTNPEIEVSMTSIALGRPFYEVSKFYNIDYRI